MALVHCEFFGKSIQKMSGLDVVVPEGRGRGPFPVLYLLHGLSDDQTVWQRRTSVERYVGGLGLIVAMPDGYRSFYVNGPPQMGYLPYEDHIVQDVVGFVEDTFPAIRRRTGRALAGLSMGGYGALMLALRHPTRFCAAAAHSSALHFAHHKEGDITRFAHLLDGKTIDGPYDCFRLAAEVVSRKDRPAIRFDCGRQDGLVSANREFRRHLRKIGYPFVYREYPGVHDWAYWDLHVRESIEFCMAHLDKPRLKA